MSIGSPDRPWVSCHWPHFGHCRPYCEVGASSSGLVLALARPFSRPVQTDMIASPEKMRLRTMSRWLGLENSLMPILAQFSPISSRMSVCSVSSPAVSTTIRSEEHTSELQSLMRISYAVFCLKKKKTHNYNTNKNTRHQ